MHKLISQNKNRKDLTVCLSLRSEQVGLGCGRLPLLSSLAPLRRPLRTGICKSAEKEENTEAREKVLCVKSS